MLREQNRKMESLWFLDDIMNCPIKQTWNCPTSRLILYEIISVSYLSQLSQGLLFADERIPIDPILTGEDDEHFAAQKFVS